MYSRENFTFCIWGGERKEAQPLSERLSINRPCGNNILLGVQRPLPVIRLRRSSRCDRGAGGVVEQREPHVNVHLHLCLTASGGSSGATRASRTVLTRVLIALGAREVKAAYFGTGTPLIAAVSEGWVIREFGCVMSGGRSPAVVADRRRLMWWWWWGGGYRGGDGRNRFLLPVS